MRNRFPKTTIKRTRIFSSAKDIRIGGVDVVGQDGLLQILVGMYQSDQMGRFLKVLGDKFSCKTNPNVITSLGYIDKRNNSVKTDVVIFFGNFWNNLGYFYFTTWSHWTGYLVDREEWSAEQKKERELLTRCGTRSLPV